MKSMVLGFLFSELHTRVALIQKQKPKWQKGYLNGIGGKQEEGESPYGAMCREFQEETGMTFEKWEHCITFTCGGGTVFVFKGEAPIRYLDVIDCHKSDNGEIIDVCKVSNLADNFRNSKPLDNLHWMIPLLLDNIAFPLTMAYNSKGGCRQEAEYLELNQAKG